MSTPPVAPVAPVAFCPTADELSLFVSGDLPGPRRAELEAHLAGCVACRGLAAAVTSTELVPLSRTSLPPDSRFLLATVDADRFTLRRQIAHGGMGRIVEAWDNRHLRPVAIKMLLRPDAEMERRFTREARITAQLQHPTIVPLYEAGRWTSGEPFFAMKLVEGRSLGQVIGDASTLAERLALLPHLVDVTEALAYAHDRGVVHRDLKPGNILVGAFGETVVVDWGLAKELDDAALSSKRRRPRDEAQDDVALTSIGQAIGTPCYMPPEQARGDDVDARADVYALGALLYHLFAGEPPHASTTVRAAIEGVLAGPPAPLAQRVPDLPADLVTIIEKAIAREPAHRYASAKSMADDLRRFTAGQLVPSHTYSPAALVRRFVGRYRAAVTTACLMMVALVVVASLGVRRVVRERDRADALKVIAHTERATAVNQRDAAEKLVEFVIGRLRERLEALGKLDLLAGVGDEVASYYRTVAPSDDVLDDAALERRGAALETLASVEEKKRNLPSAIALGRARIDVYERLLARAPRRSEARAELAAAWLLIGRPLGYRGEGAEGLAATERGAALATALATDEPGDARWRVLDAYAQSLVGYARMNRDDVDAARTAVARARAALAAIDEGALTNMRWMHRHASSWANVGSVAQMQGDMAGAMVAYEKHNAIRKRQVDAEPGNAERESALAWGLTAMGWAEENAGEVERALVDDRAGVALRRNLVARDPQNFTHAWELVHAAAALCDLSREWEGFGHAELTCREAMGEGIKLTTARPSDPSAQHIHARALRGMGRWHLAAGHAEESARAFRASLVLDEALVLRDPKNRLWQHDVVECQWGIARASKALRKNDDALASAEAALGAAAAQDAAAPGDPLVQAAHGQALLVLGQVRRARGERAAAERALASAVEKLERAAGAAESDVELQIDFAEASIELGELRARPEARGLHERAASILEALDRAHRLSPERRALLRRARAQS